jgi:hypothetical protein
MGGFGAETAFSPQQKKELHATVLWSASAFPFSKNRKNIPPYNNGQIPDHATIV